MKAMYTKTVKISDLAKSIYDPAAMMSLLRDLTGKQYSQDEKEEFLRLLGQNSRFLRRWEQSYQKGSSPETALVDCNTLEIVAVESKGPSLGEISFVFNYPAKKVELSETPHVAADTRTGVQIPTPEADAAVEMPTTPSVMADEQNRPPKLGEFVLYLFLERRARAAILGDLAEDYILTRRRFGKRHAWCFYWCQVVRSIGPFVVAFVKRIVRWGLIGQAIRRYFS